MSQADTDILVRTILAITEEDGCFVRTERAVFLNKEFDSQPLAWISRRTSRVSKFYPTNLAYLLDGNLVTAHESADNLYAVSISDYDGLRDLTKQLFGKKTPPTIDHVYYDTGKAKGIFNKKPIGPVNDSRKLMRLLVKSHPEPVLRRTLIQKFNIIGDTRYQSDELSKIFSGLRDACGVDHNVISLRTNGYLNANVHKLDKS